MNFDCGRAQQYCNTAPKAASTDIRSLITTGWTPKPKGKQLSLVADMVIVHDFVHRASGLHKVVKWWALDCIVDSGHTPNYAPEKWTERIVHAWLCLLSTWSATQCKVSFAWQNMSSELCLAYGRAQNSNLDTVPSRIDLTPQNAILRVRRIIQWSVSA